MFINIFIKSILITFFIKNLSFASDQTILDQATELYNEEKYLKSIELLKQIPDNVSAQYKLGYNYWFGLKDIDNSLNVLNENGVILLHDCLPAKIWHQTIPQTHSSWNGDVWKSIVQSRTREDIDTYTIKADQGLGLILKRKNRDKLVHPINNFKNLKFKDYYNHHEKFMRLIDENKVLETIG